MSRTEEIRARAYKATPTTEHIKRARYDHGGGRMYRETGNDRDLILDVYDEGDREFYFNALEDMEFLLSKVREPLGPELLGDPLTSQLLDLIKLMPDAQTQVIIDFINDMRLIRSRG